MSRIFRLRLRFHGSCPVAVIVITAIVVTQFPEAVNFWRRMLLGLFAALLFFAAIGIREFVLLVLALSRRIPVNRLTLFVHGAAHDTLAEATRPVLERLLAVAGLVLNLTMSVAFYGVFVAMVIAGNDVIAGLAQWLAYIFLVLSLLHFLPGWPLDGGRLLVAYLWQTGGNYYRAIRISTWIGTAAAVALVIGGLAVMAVGRQWLIGLLMVLVGWALFRGASLGRRQAAFHEALDGFSAGQIMNTEGKRITSQMSVSDVVRDHVLVSGQRYFLVVDDGKLEGVLTLRKIRSLPKKRWEQTTVGKIMVSAARLPMAYGKQSANSLLQQMDDSGLNEMPVTEEDGTIGVVTRDTVLRLAETRSRLRV